MKVFVCYTSKDPAITDEKLKQVENRIKPHAKVFIDRLHNKKGKQCRVEKELKGCDIVLQLVSSQYKSEWVQKELVTARKKGKPVIKSSLDEILSMEDEQLYLFISDVEKKGWSVWTILSFSLLVCLFISLIGIYLSYLYVDCQNISESGSSVLNSRGAFGDSWGGVNAIISAFAFAGVIVTLFLQNRDLNLQRKEMARQREEFEKENATLKYQRFENLFYNMLNLQQEIVNSLKFDYEEKKTELVPTGGEYGPIPEQKIVNKSVSGRVVFRFTFDDAEIYDNKNIYYGYRKFLNVKGLSDYDNTWIPTYFDHYFRHLYKIIQYVDNQGFPFNESYKYVSLLRGTLSRYELVWIYYNALNPSFIKFKKLIEKYSLLKNIRKDLLTRTQETEIFYNDHGISPKDLLDKGFSHYDFEFYLTDNKEEIGKYHISAFWKKEEIEEGYDLLNRWRSYIDNNIADGVKVENGQD